MQRVGNRSVNSLPRSELDDRQTSNHSVPERNPPGLGAGRFRFCATMRQRRDRGRTRRGNRADEPQRRAVPTPCRADLRNQIGKQ